MMPTCKKFGDHMRDTKREFALIISGDYVKAAIYMEVHV